MKGSFMSRRAKSVVTTLLLAGLVLSHTKPGEGNGAFWISAHCIIGMSWFLCTLLHVWQHWGLIKALTRKRVMLRNKTTATVTVCFLLMGVSLLLLAFGTGSHVVKFHHFVGHLYVLTVVVHTFVQFKAFRSRALLRGQVR